MKKVFIIVILITSSILLNASKYVAYWSFEDSTAKDFSGNNYHGTIVNSPTPDVGYNGTGTSMRFYGFGVNTNSGDHIELPRIPFESLSEFTISMWVKEESVTQRGGEFYISFGDHNSGWLGIGNHIEQPDYGQTERSIHVSVGSYLYGSEALYIKHGGSIMKNWTFHVMTYDGETIEYFMNGKYMGSKIQTLDVGSNNGSIAKHYWSTGSAYSTRFNGWIDEVKIYDKVLTEEEIEKEYHGCDDRSFFYNEQPNDFNFEGSAEQVDDFIVLTYPNTNVSGAVWFKDHVPVDYGFTADFSFMIQATQGYELVEEEVPGADGFAFVIQTHSPNYLGSIGGYLGYTEIDNSLSVEIDLYPNTAKPFYDPDENHLAVFGLKDKHNNFHGSDAEIATTSNIPKISPDSLYYCTIQYDKINEKLKIWLGNQPQKELILELDDFNIKDYIELIDDHAAFVGITASTGYALQLHELYSFDFCIEPNDYINSVEEFDSYNYDLSIFPSPSSDQISIRSAEDNVITEFEIFDVLGKKIISKYNKNDKELIIDISSLSAGTYFLRAKIENEYLNKKFVVLK